MIGFHHSAATTLFPGKSASVKNKSDDLQESSFFVFTVNFLIFHRKSSYRFCAKDVNLKSDLKITEVFLWL